MSIISASPAHPYDHIISLGANCSVAVQLQLRGLRLESGPVDWIACGNPQLLFSTLTRWFTTEFDAILTHPLRLIPGEEDLFGYKTFLDETDGYLFVHDLISGVPSEAEIATARSRYQRRGKRLIERLKATDRWLFVLTNARNQWQDEQVEAFLQWLRTTFPTAHIDLLYVKFSSLSDALEEPLEGLFIQHVKKRFRFRREMKKSKAFQFLNSLHLTIEANPDAWEAKKRTEEQLLQSQNEILAKRIAYWKSLDRKKCAAVRAMLRLNWERRMTRFSHLPMYIRLLMWLFIFCRWQGFLKLIPSRQGITA